MSQIARGSYKATFDGLTYLKTIRSGIGSRERFAWRLRLADQNSSQGNDLRRNVHVHVSSVYPEDLSADLLPEIFKFDNPSCPLKRIRYNWRTIITGNYYPKCIAELHVLCNLEDLDFNGAVYPTT